MSDALLNEMGWEALANIRLRHLEKVNAENASLRDRAERAEAAMENEAIVTRDLRAALLQIQERAKNVKGNGLCHDFTVKAWARAAEIATLALGAYEQTGGETK